MSLLNKLTETDLGLKGQDIPKRDGKAESTIDTQATELSLKGKKPSSYTDVAKAAGINIDRVVDLTPPQ